MYGRRVVKMQKKEGGSLSSVPSEDSLLRMGSQTSESSRGERHVLRKAMFERVLEGKQALKKKMKRLN